jgi:hypothetical protein
VGEVDDVVVRIAGMLELLQRDHAVVVEGSQRRVAGVHAKHEEAGGDHEQRQQAADEEQETGLDGQSFHGRHPGDAPRRDGYPHFGPPTPYLNPS